MNLCVRLHIERNNSTIIQLLQKKIQFISISKGINNFIPRLTIRLVYMAMKCDASK